MAMINNEQFWKSISILLRNYHAVNKKIFACVFSEAYKVIKGINSSVFNGNNADGGYLTPVELFEDGKLLCEKCTDTETQSILQSTNSTTNKLEGLLIYYKYLTKKLPTNIDVLVIINFTTNTYTCRFSNCHIDDFSIEYRNHDFTTIYLTNRLDAENNARWAEYVLRPKLLKWCQSTSCKSTASVESLQLINMEHYNNLYKHLKEKYAAKAINLFRDARESTDPLKFVYEDLAIAAYLITLWQHPTYSTGNNDSPTVFADLGCGNGLLVYILNEEGYKGYGYDIRSRKLWSHYPPTIQLYEQVIDPNTFRLPEDVNWLIGNHSDELSPWLPILAAVSSYRMCYFLLPCCAFELSGYKFQRRNSGVSGYQDFYEYAYDLSVKSGFRTLKDRLKIPSTKRLALIGIERLYGASDFEIKRREIQEYVMHERSKHSHNIVTTTTPVSIADVKFREKYESVRNCTQIDKSITEKLVKQIFEILLAAISEVKTDEKSIWTKGGEISIRDIAQQLSPNDLRQIKSECGGIKTLLRNKHEIFEFRGNDRIAIRKPRIQHTSIKTKQNQVLKKRLCFFKQHHPNGCPLRDDECTFIH